MLVQFYTDSNIDGTEALHAHVESMVRTGLERLSSKLTRVEIHLSDQNSDKKSGAADKRCVLEARPAGLQPITASDRAESIDQAVRGAIDKLKRALDHTLGRLDSR